MPPVLILFAKIPTPGQVKTRLQPSCTPAQAARIGEVLLEETVKSALRHWPGPVELAVWPPGEHPVLARARDRGVPVYRQGPGGLGENMYRAIAAHTGQGRPAAVLGCDVPHCPPQVFAEAYALLQTHQAVLGPSRDGGYYLIGLDQAEPALFDAINWGTDQVTAQTLAKAQRLGIRFHTLAELVDLDTWPTLMQIKDQVPSLAEVVDKITLSRKKTAV